MSEDFNKERELMVESQVKARGVVNERVLEALRKVPRHEFVPEKIQGQAYNDEPLAIGSGQTISQPYIVAYMTEMLQIKKGDRILEVGTGSGYQTAVLAEIADQVFSIEILETLSLQAQAVLENLGYKKIRFKVGDGAFGWKKYAPYDGIIVTAAPTQVPEALQEQLKLGSRLIVPVGEMFQDLILVTSGKNKNKKKKLISVRFVPLVRKPS